MKALVLTQAPHRPHIVRILHELAARGVEAETSGYATQLVGPITRDRSATGLADVLIPRIVDLPQPNGPPVGFGVLRFLEALGMPTTTPAAAAEVAWDKWRTALALDEAGIPQPRTWLTGTPPDDLRELPLPLLLKPQTGTGGRGIRLIESMEDLLRHAPILRNLLLQEFIEEAEGVDRRAIVRGGDVIAAARRSAPAGDFRSNVSRGGHAEATRLSPDECALAVRSAQAVGLAFAGIDLIRSKRGPLVLEVNAFPAFAGIEAASAVNVAAVLVDHALEVARQ